MSQTMNEKPAFSLAYAVGYFICVSGFVLCVTAFYPGFMSPDSISQLTEARAWNFTDWHPPAMAALWGVVDKVVPGPFGMLLLHNVAFWGAALLFWHYTKRKSVLLGLGLAALGFMPQVLSNLNTIWKDTGLGVSLFLVSALLYVACQTKSKIALILTLPFIFYAYAVRLNAAPAILPIALWSGFIACRVFPGLKTNTARFKFLPVVIGIAYFLFLSAAVMFTTAILIKGKKNYAAQQVWFHDLAAISKANGRSAFPDFVSSRSNFSLENISAQYRPDLATSLYSTDQTGLNMIGNPPQISELRTAWLKAVLGNGMIYLAHRWDVYKVITGFNTQNVCYPFLLASYPSYQLGYSVAQGSVAQSLIVYFRYFERSVLFRGFFWILLSLGLVYLSIRGRLNGDLETAFVLSLSGLLYGVGYFFYAPSCDFRFLWWTMISASVSLMFFVAYVAGHWLNGRRAQAAQAS
ncbi:MAG: hypothetical protein H0W76_12650 [Pyrinomonadaceae bacterium]|nr:hypothetical protein [Pyrinomonadaceae bacterium]